MNTAMKIPAYETMTPSAKKMRDFYAMRRDAPIYQTEFGYYVLEKWIAEGYLKPRDEEGDYDAYLRSVFGYDEPAVCSVGGLGWCEAAFLPAFEEKLLEDRGTHELVQDCAGRQDSASAGGADLVAFCSVPRSRIEIAQFLGLESVPYASRVYIAPAVREGVLRMTLPDKPRSSKQRYVAAR